ncbi:hypothetical protein PsorP6_007917 [Peronosclerospora sorghi]|uniref:Uncharacterized protein n=1 Tax=Peronosclerospora sorghi TaxID=230839 RepID=A0ACC0WAD6_9STRA|nr:hypothetical protein PsorP6_007917 [Peronosclerospora sorghi]
MIIAVNPSSHDFEETLRTLNEVSIIDLAGVELDSKTIATGIQMQEASKISGYLMNLMRCIEIVRWNQQHPPSLQKNVNMY